MRLQTRFVRLGVLLPVAVGILGFSAFATASATAAEPTVTSVTPDSGPVTGGTDVKIIGTGFQAGAKVLIGQGNGVESGAIEATEVTVLSATEITAVTGGGANRGVWGLYVTTTAGTSAPSTGAEFTYTTAARPTVTSVTPDSGPAAGGTEVKIIGTGFRAGAKVLIGQGNGVESGAIEATEVTVRSATEITAVTGGGAKSGVWGLYVTTTAGTSASSRGAEFTYTAAARPTVTSVTPDSGPVTGGTEVKIIGTGFQAGAKVLIGQGNGAEAGAIEATEVTVRSATEITAVTGGGAKSGVWGLYVTTTAGTSAASRGGEFTYR